MQTLAGVTLREYVLAEVLQGAGYDVIALDCAPSVDLLHFAALVAADYLLIPTRLDKLAVNGVRDAFANPGGAETDQPLPGGRDPVDLL
jgi:cellulose biosynthesis protein BcsQ